MNSTVDPINAVAQFCQVINDNMPLDRQQRRLALTGVPLPVGFSSVALCHADEGREPAFMFSEEGALSALSVAACMSVMRCGSVEPAPHQLPDDGLMVVIISDDPSQADRA